jgi:hypothetical protein
MAIIQGNAKKSTAAGGFYPKTIEGSLRFNDDDSAYLTWTPDSAGNRKTWTLSLWTKRGRVDNANTELFGTAPEGDKLSFTDSRIFWFNEGSSQSYLSTTALFRDPSAWYHIVLAFDTTQATASNRVKLYVNGEQVAFDNNTTFPSQNYNGDISNAQVHYIGRAHGSNYYDGYLAEVHFTDGTAYDADAFGEFKNGVWVAKTPDVTYGTNGFYLDFQDDTEVEAFNTITWRGDGSGTLKPRTGVGFSPDLVWIKNRDGSNHHLLFDSVRGAGSNKELSSNNTTAEGGLSLSGYDWLSSFDSDGFTTQWSGSNIPYYTNQNGYGYVAWGWKAGDSNVSNTDGSITSTVRANDTYGFSIVSYTGTGSSGTIGHGLSTAPAMIITKDRESGTQEWAVYHKDLTAGYSLFLNTTGAQANRPQDYTTTAPTTSVYSVGGGNPTSGLTDDYIAYCWAEKSGYSKFGSYTGNGSTDGPEVTTGFKPAFVMVKRTDSASGNGWYMWDGTRSTTNPIHNTLIANLSGSEDPTSEDVNFLSDGFKLLRTYGDFNASGGTYIYAAFADTREAAFWLDQSGNDNDWQPVNLDHNDTVADSPTNNFATWNPIQGYLSSSFNTGSPSGTNSVQDGNLSITGGDSQRSLAWASTIAANSGKFYAEFVPTSQNYVQFGVGSAETWWQTYGIGGAGKAQVWGDGVIGWDRTIYYINSTSSTSGGVSFSGGDVIQIAFDADTRKVWFGVNNTWNGGGNPAAGTGEIGTVSGDDPLVFICRPESTTVVANFGQQPFKYDPPA